MISYQKEDISIGCKGACDDKPCQNGATCLESWTSYECVCLNPFAHLGINCENDINEKAITFSSNTEALYYSSGFIDESSNPLNSNFTFNFKTNEPRCILFLATDYVQNIIQIYMENSTTIVLLLNFGNDLQEIKVKTLNNYLSEGQSVQIAVKRYENRTDCVVLTRGQIFSSSFGMGVTLITEEDYKQYPYEVQNHLVQYQHSFTIPEKYSLIFIGGVKSHGATTDLPSLIGCFRGLRINETDLDFSDENSWNLGSGVMLGCESKCEKNEEVCVNGGRCIDAFPFNSSKEDFNFFCDCQGTSYVGLNCDEETAYSFNGADDGMAFFRRIVPYDDFLKITFAFASEPPSPSLSQLLLFLKLNNTRSSGTENLTITYYDENLLLKWLKGEESLVLESEALEGAKRHLVEIIFRHSEIRFLVDENIYSVLFTNSSSLSNSSNEYTTENDTGLIIIGGASYDLRSSVGGDLKNFNGCISNLRITSSFVDILPLESYKNGENVIHFGLPKMGRCPVFYLHKTTPVFYDFSKISEWKPPEPDVRPIHLQQSVLLNDLHELDAESSSLFPDITNMTSNGTDYFYDDEYDVTTGKIWPWALLGTVFFLMVLLLLVLVLKRCCRAKSKAEDKDLERAKSNAAQLKLGEQEGIPLLENEPSSHRARPNVDIERAPYELNPSDSVRQEFEKTKKDNLPLHQSSNDDKEERESTPKVLNNNNNERVTPSGAPEQSSKPIAIPLNSINRDSKSKIPFKNQLSSDANTLRHIDSSSSEDSLRALPFSPPEKHSSLNDLISEDKQENSEESNDDQDNSNTGTNNPNMQQNVDMKKFYLIRKSSEPPILPPKKK